MATPDPYCWSMETRAWRFRFDAKDVGCRERWFDPASPCDGPAWRDVAVPAAWNQLFGDQTPDVAWYRNRLPTPTHPGARWWLHFGAVCTDLVAWCDGVRVAEHSGNWEPFAIELPGDAPQRDVALRVDRVRPGPAQKLGDRVIEQGHITKGFYDVLSRQPAGLWQPVSLRRTGPFALQPLGVGVTANADNGQVEIDLYLEPASSSCAARLTLRDDAGHTLVTRTLDRLRDHHSTRLHVANPQRWSPQSPTLYELNVELIDETGMVSDGVMTRFGFRRVRTEGGRILLNDRPTFLRGMLDWGHEPMQTAPAAAPGEVRRRFAALRAMGVNCVCVCMWYPPQWFYDIADETGMLLWQEHPVWKSPMHPELRPQYQEHYERFFRLDRNHPSVIVVSGSCEHEAFDPQLAAWWWDRAGRLLPDRLRQVQTAFLDTTPEHQTDLYDEHTYENSGRWPQFLDDMDATLASRPPKPFVMGESILYNDWPDVDGLLAVLGDRRPWWVWKALNDAARLERAIAHRLGRAALERFRAHARRWHVQGRKWQTEVFRANPAHGGMVHNSLRDVAVCPLGFMDDLDRWRLTPADTRAWLGEAVLLLQTPGYMRCLPADQPWRLRLGVSNFATVRIGDAARVTVTCDALGWRQEQRLALAADPGENAWVSWRLDPPPVQAPTAVEIRAELAGAEPNIWRLWLTPAAQPLQQSLACEQVADTEPVCDFEERRYSSGWGLAVTSWRMQPPDPAALLPEARRFSDAPPDDADILVTTTLSDATLKLLVAGRRVLHLPAKQSGALRTVVPTLWGQSPLIVNRGPLADVHPDFVLDALDRDLHHRWIRSVPASDLNLADSVEPFIRQVLTHNATEHLAMRDDVFAARVGRGLLLVSSLDHATIAGRYLLDRFIHWLAQDPSTTDAELSLPTLHAARRTD